MNKFPIVSKFSTSIKITKPFQQTIQTIQYKKTLFPLIKTKEKVKEKVWIKESKILGFKKI